MAVTQPAALHQNPELWCHHCGHREGLPSDAAERHRHLRLRLMQLSRAREASEAPLQTFKAMNGVWPMAIAFSGLMGVYQSYNFLNSWQVLAKVDPSQAVFGAVPLAVSCNATNLLDAALTTNAAVLLAQETQEYERRMRPWARDPNVYLGPSRTFYRYAAVGAGAALAALSAIALLLLR